MLLLQTQSLTAHQLPTRSSSSSQSSWPSSALPRPLSSALRTCFTPSKPNPFPIFSIQSTKCSASPSSSAVLEPTQLDLTNNNRKEKKPFQAEVARTIMELSSVGTLSTLSQDGWPLGIGVPFAVDSQGTPILCLNHANAIFVSDDMRSTLHVQLEQCGLRTPQCTVLGNLAKLQDNMASKKLSSLWKSDFREEVNEDLLYVVSVERVLHMEDFGEDGVWVTSADYKLAKPDPLRDFAGKFVDEINANHVEDVYRFCSIYADLDFQVLDAKMVWVDRLGFDIRVRSSENDVFEVRIPFPGEVTDEKGAKSSFNCMSQFAWEVEKNFNSPDFEKVKQVKKIMRR